MTLRTQYKKAAHGQNLFAFFGGLSLIFGENRIVIAFLIVLFQIPKFCLGQSFGIATQKDIRTATGHVGSNGHRAEAAGLGDNFRFQFMVFGI